MSTGPGGHRGAAQQDVEALAAYRSTSARALVVQFSIVLLVVVIMVVWLGPYGALFAPLLGLPLGQYLRGRRLARREQVGA